MNNVITSYSNGTAQKTTIVAPEQTFESCCELLDGTEYIGIRRDIEGSVQRFFSMQDGEPFEIADPSMR